MTDVVAVTIFQQADELLSNVNKTGAEGDGSVALESKSQARLGWRSCASKDSSPGGFTSNSLPAGQLRLVAFSVERPHRESTFCPSTKNMRNQNIVRARRH